jgi:hypothetical protein
MSVYRFVRSVAREIHVISTVRYAAFILRVRTNERASSTIALLTLIASEIARDTLGNCDVDGPLE